MPPFRPSSSFITEAMKSAGVRGELKKKAHAVARRVDSVGSSEGLEMNAQVTSGTRPKGRPYSRVQSDQVSQEWGNRFVKRRRILGRVAENG